MSDEHVITIVEAGRKRNLNRLAVWTCSCGAHDRVPRSIKRAHNDADAHVRIAKQIEAKQAKEH